MATIQLAQPLAQYTEYVNATLSELRRQLATLQSAADAGNLEAAERAWLPAHITYLEIGQDDEAYGSFGDLGEKIDGLAAGLPNTTTNPKFTGFHKVEFDLWRHHDVPAAARDTKNWCRRRSADTRDGLSGPAARTHSLDGWVLRCHEILEDGLRDSLTADDDYGSNSDLASLAADVKATTRDAEPAGPSDQTPRSDDRAEGDDRAPDAGADDQLRWRQRCARQPDGRACTPTAGD